MTSLRDVASPLGRIDRRAASLNGVAYLKLRDAILSGQLKPGQSLVEEQIAADLSISRTPLREALARLEHEGLIESIPYRGTVVVSATLSEVMQIIQVRERLEALAIELAILAIPTEEIEQTVSLIQARLPLLERGDLNAHFECNRQVHGLAGRHCGNAVLEGLIGGFEDRTQTYRIRKASEISPIPEIVASAKEHLAILESYRQRDLPGAVQLMCRHLERTRQRLDRSPEGEQR
jgi:DNA-binding GntR family transcriptional regulator